MCWIYRIILCLLGGVFVNSQAFAIDSVDCKITGETILFGQIDPFNIKGTTSFALPMLNCFNRDIDTTIHWCLTVTDISSSGIGFVDKRYIYWQSNDDKKYNIPFDFYHEGKILGGTKGEYGVPITGTYKPRDNPVTRFPLTVILDKPEETNIKLGDYSAKFNIAVYWTWYHPIMSDETKRRMCKEKGSNIDGVRITQATLQVEARVQGSCSVTADNINFGKLMDLKNAPDREGKIKVKCSTPTVYEIGLGHGYNENNNALRTMFCLDKKKCNNSVVFYNLYTDIAHTNIWTDKWKTNGVVSGSSNGNTKEATVYAAIDKSQGTPPAGSYTDNITVTVQFSPEK